ncbi:MAG TPA: type IV secretion system DNA-binding domain-containing protein, partial [Tepidisphaeraceae bacterium]|nr:type IV secretion system DNA-binding domain-containing protein [Tepidisphaeraceae bacterium]
MINNSTVRIGTREAWGQRTAFGLSRRDRRQHCYVVGKTGVGKSTLLRNMLLQDIAAGDGVGLIDPHGDLAHEILDYIPPRRTRDVIYFNPADHDWPVGLNLVRPVSREERHLVADGVVSAFKSIWRDSWGPRLQHVLYACVAALLECSNVS